MSFRLHGIAASLLIAVAIQGGCAQPNPADSEADATSTADQEMAIDQVPPEILKTAQDQRPGVNFRFAKKGWDNGVLIYKLEGRSDEGKIHQVEVTAAGEVVKPTATDAAPDPHSPPPPETPPSEPTE